MPPPTGVARLFPKASQPMTRNPNVLYGSSWIGATKADMATRFLPVSLAR